jgi:hypothetical protein
VIVKFNPEPCINEQIFLDYIRSGFLLNHAELRSLKELAEEDMLSLMYNCASRVIDLRTREQVASKFLHCVQRRSIISLI